MQINLVWGKCLSSYFSPISLILCSKEPRHLIGFYFHGKKVNPAFIKSMGVWMICSAGSRGEEKFSFNDHPVHSLWSQMPSGWSVLVFGLVTRFHKEVPGLTFRSIDNNRLFSTLQPLCLPFRPLALWAPWSLLTQGTSHTARQWEIKAASQASCFRLICLAVLLTTTVLSLEDCWI